MRHLTTPSEWRKAALPRTRPAGTHIPMRPALMMLMLPLLAGCSVGESREAARHAGATPRELVVRARDFQFDAPDTVPSGPTRIRLLNEGPDFHHVWLVRLDRGKTVADLMGHLATGHESMPTWATDVGGPNTPGAPGEETSAVLDLEPGRYAMICVIPAPDGRLHVMRGMVRPLTVVPGKGDGGAMPPADLVMTLEDYSYRLDQPITSGSHTIRVENVAEQTHEVVVIRLEPGRSAGDFLAWLMNREGPAPAKPVGGVTGLSRGESNLITIDFEPGDYALLCFVPDAGDGKPHVAHGMVKQFSVG